MNMQDEVNQVVIHELIHAYDECRAANLDWANCAHHACSEVRPLKSRFYTYSCTFELSSTIEHEFFATVFTDQS